MSPICNHGDYAAASILGESLGYRVVTLSGETPNFSNQTAGHECYLLRCRRKFSPIFTKGKELKCNFPEGFVEKYEEILGDEARDFLASFEEETVSAFRINPLKEAPVSFPDAIPQTPWGHYGKVSGKSPEHATGLVYSQEPAAQMVAQVAKPSPGMRFWIWPLHRVENQLSWQPI